MKGFIRAWWSGGDGTTQIEGLAMAWDTLPRLFKTLVLLWFIASLTVIGLLVTGHLMFH